MKIFQFIPLSILFFSFVLAHAQKPKVTVSEYTKHKKSSGIDGIFTIDGKPFLLALESVHMVVDYSANFYPINDDNTLGDVIRQENVNVNMGDLALEKCLFIESIIVSNGTTFLFYSKRDGGDVTIYYVELKEDCQIDESEATEVMKTKTNKVAKNCDFAVRQSPDKSKILLVGMTRGSAKNSTFFFKTYTAGMKSLIWEKTIEAARSNEAFFSGYNRFNTVNDNDGVNYNSFLINNEGRVFFLSDWSNPSGQKHDLNFISIDPSGKTKTEAEVPFKGEYYVRQFFRLTPSGKAQLTLFYSTNKLPKVEPTNQWGADVNALSFLEYDGKTVDVKADYTMDEEAQSQFYPVKFRKPKSDYRVGGYEIIKSIDLPNGELAFQLCQSFSTVGTERPFSNTAHGFVCVLILDSNYQIKSCTPMVSGFGGNGIQFLYGGGSNLVHIDNKVVLFYKDENQVAQMLVLGEGAQKPVNIGAGMNEIDGMPSFNYLYYSDKTFIVPFYNSKKGYGLCAIKVN